MPSFLSVADFGNREVTVASADLGTGRAREREELACCHCDPDASDDEPGQGSSGCGMSIGVALLIGFTGRAIEPHRRSDPRRWLPRTRVGPARLVERNLQ